MFVVPVGEDKDSSVSKDNFFSQIDYDRTYDRAYASQVSGPYTHTHIHSYTHYKVS